MSDSDPIKTKTVFRSDGRSFLTFALLCTVASVITAITATQVAVDPTAQAIYGHPDYDGLARQWWWLVLSGSLGSTAVLLFMVGSIIRAIWFLPGSETKQLQQMFPDRGGVKRF